MASHFHHAHLFGSNLDESLAFYERWFDAKVVAEELAERMAEAGLSPGPIRVPSNLDYFMVEAPDSVLLEVFNYKLAPGVDADLDQWFIPN